MQVFAALSRCFAPCIGSADTDIEAGPPEQAEPLLRDVQSVSNAGNAMQPVEPQRQQEVVRPVSNDMLITHLPTGITLATEFLPLQNRPKRSCSFPSVQGEPGYYTNEYIFELTDDEHAPNWRKLAVALKAALVRPSPWEDAIYAKIKMLIVEGGTSEDAVRALQNLIDQCASEQEIPDVQRQELLELSTIEDLLGVFELPPRMLQLFADTKLINGERLPNAFFADQSMGRGADNAAAVRRTRRSSAPASA